MRSVCQGEVVSGEAFLEGGGRRDDNGEAGAEPKRKDVVVCF